MRGRGLWAGLALTPILIALVALAAVALGGSGTAAAGPKAEGFSLAAAKARTRPTMTRTEAVTAVAKYWTAARVAKATDPTTGRTGKPDVPDVVPGPPHTSLNHFWDFAAKPQSRSVAIYYTQGGTEHVCAGGIIGYDDPNSATTIQGPANVVWTAGRCVHRGDALESGWSDNLMACPIHASTGPFVTNNPAGQPASQNRGCWVWSSESTTPEWYTDNWESRDYGVIFMTNTRVAAPCSGTSCTVITGTDIAAFPTATPAGTFTLCDESSAAGHTPGTQCAYNLPRAQAWWMIGYHNPFTLQPPVTNNQVADPYRRGGCTPTGTAAPPRECFALTPRVTQAQYAATHAALASNPAGGAADTGPGTNTVGAYEQAGVDASRLAAGDCPEQYKGTGQAVPNQTAPCTGTFTGAPWIVSSGVLNQGWAAQVNGRFGSMRLNGNTSFADVGEDDLANVGPGVYGGSMQGTYFDTVTCFDYQAWTGWPGTC
jgi:hypothetical protein